MRNEPGGYFLWAACGKTERKTAHLRVKTGCLKQVLAGYLLLAAALLVGMERLVVAMLVRVVQGRLFGVFFGVGREAIGGEAVVGCFFVVAFFQVLHGRAVVLHGVLKIVGGLFVGFNDFLVFFGMVSHGK